jgi:acyl-CoA thioesterase-2
MSQRFYSWPVSSPTESVEEQPAWVARLLELSRDGESDMFEGRPQAAGGPRLFGGHVAAQALAAAAATVDLGRIPHALHGSFLRVGKSSLPVRYSVERTRDGRSFSTRRVVAAQRDVVFEMTAAFHTPEPGIDWHREIPAVPSPSELPSLPPRVNAPSTGFFEIRPLVPTDGPFSPPPYWIRAREPIGDDPVAATCVLTFMSDMGVVAAARAPLPDPPTAAVSLNHAVWFHRPFAAHQWHLFSAEPATNHGALGLVAGSFRREDGTLIATIMQEALLRTRPR